MKKLGLRGMILVAVAVAAVQAQDDNAECTLRGRDTVITSGSTVKQCLNVEALSGQSVVIPKNVTRIDSTGFSLCESSVNQGGQADIVYVMDQSGSMEIRYVWVSPDKLDTLYLENVTNNGCNITNADRTNADNFLYGRITLPRDAGTRDYPLLNPAKRPVNCATSGDPFAQRAVAFKQAIDFQALRAPASAAGYVGFAGTVVNQTTLRLLNSTANIAAVKANITPRYENNTNYMAALDAAKKQFAASTNPQKAVIFLSDGRPTTPDSNSHLQVLQATYPAAPGVMPPVYGIYMGNRTPDTAKLFEISQLTGGRFYLIPPNRPDSLRTVVEGILSIIFKQFQPNSASVKNTTIIPNQTGTANSSSFVKQEGNGWLINFSQKVGLSPNVPNAIEFKSELREVASGELQPKNANFSLSTTGPEEQTNRNLPGTQFSIVCKELPPDINLVREAYIRDTDGDGTGDKVFFVFSRPLKELPATIDTVYWNRVDPALANKQLPKLSFLPGSNNTVVVADFTASPYPKGMTSIPDPLPAGELPVGVLPPGGVFQSQRPRIKDSIGPILDSGLTRPFDNSKVSSGGALNMDTLVIFISEKMKSSQGFNEMLLWGKPVNGQCNDYANAKPVVSAKNPDQGPTANSLIFYVQNGLGGPTPIAGDCIYVKVNGDYLDLPGNLPPQRGIQLRGRTPPRVIELMRGFPPVVGYKADDPRFVLINNDPRRGDGMDYSKPDPNGTGVYEITWVPPVGFDPNAPAFVPFIPKTPNELPGVNKDVPGVVTAFPRTISALQIVSTGKYIADVSIFDTQGRFMKSFRQAFGYQGELNNGARVVNKGLVSYLVWDMKDAGGQKAGQGVFIWKVLFTFENGKQEIQYTRTGVMRNVEWYWK